jgi:Uma2 family endonuclease
MTLLSKNLIVYPEPDGSPPLETDPAESDPARDYLVYGVEALKLYFRDREDVYVSGNLWLSYQQGVPDAVVAPEVFVVFGVENRPRRSYWVWQEQGKTPDWVLEVTSNSTSRKDDQEKPDICAQMGVSEYFQYDPTGDYLNPALKGRRFQGNRYQALIPSYLEDGTLVLPSQVLDLDLHLMPQGQLRFYHPQMGEYLRTYQEERDRGDRLAAQLRALGIEPDL